MTHVPPGPLLCLLLLLPMPLRGDAPTPTLQMTPSERAFFQLGDQIGRAAFSYADLARRAAEVARTRSRLTQLQRLTALAPLAEASRAGALAGFGHALTLMQSLQAPAAVLAPIRAATERLGKPVALAGDALAVSLFNGKAGRTLGTLDEFTALASLPEDDAVQRWVASPAAGPSGRVWYAEGLIAALAEIAAARRMPQLLPPVTQIATDLRGLRDWLTLRLPEPPTPDQAALLAAVNAFLGQTSRTGTPQATPLTAAQLQALGDISRRLQAQVLGDASQPAAGAVNRRANVSRISPQPASPSPEGMGDTDTSPSSAEEVSEDVGTAT